MDDRDIADAIVDLLGRRAVDASICPSEAARALPASDWRDAMPRVREVAAKLAATGCVRVTQGDAQLPVQAIADARGPLRLRRGPRFPG